MVQRNTSNDIVCFRCNRMGHNRDQCPMNRTQRAATMCQMTEFTPYSEPQYTFVGHHQCDDSRAEGEIKLACGCFIPIVAGALSPDRQIKLKQWQTQMTPCCDAKVNGTTTQVMRDTGSTTCVVKTSLVRPEQITMVSMSFVCSLLVVRLSVIPRQWFNLAHYATQ